MIFTERALRYLYNAICLVILAIAAYGLYWLYLDAAAKGYIR